MLRNDKTACGRCAGGFQEDDPGARGVASASVGSISQHHTECQDPLDLSDIDAALDRERTAYWTMRDRHEYGRADEHAREYARLYAIRHELEQRAQALDSASDVP